MSLDQKTNRSAEGSHNNALPKSQNKFLMNWIREVANLVTPDQIVWCDGSRQEYNQMVGLMVDQKEFTPLNDQSYPGCYLYRSDIDDVARAEHLTFICTEDKETAGPNNNWMSPADGHGRVDPLFAGSMKGRTMYVVPYCMGPIESPYAQFGVEITDSPYVVINMGIMTRMGAKAYEKIDGLGAQFVRGLHCTRDLSPERRWIMHFPEEMMIKSVGSGYGGNALLGKKCHGLRLASYQARQQGWLAEHMLIVGIENPEGEKTYIAAAFPSACGKTNLAMLIPPESYNGWKVWTVGDDIAWLRPGEDGRLWAVNPENGFFGVAPGTSGKTNPHAASMIKQNTIFTNVALTSNNEPWWEGKDDGAPQTTWKNKAYDGLEPAAHPNARFTVSCSECPSYEAPAPEGVPISAILFGSRRAELVPLVFEAKDWTEGVLAGAAMCSETTAAATGKVGVLRNDPMAMKPFCGYNFGDYWAHWLKVGQSLRNPPKVFHVNWFRRSKDGEFLWPGFGENLRVLDWIVTRVQNKIGAQQTPLGYLPHLSDLNLEGLSDFDPKTLKELLDVDGKAYAEHLSSVNDYFGSFGSHAPAPLVSACKAMIQGLSSQQN